MIQIGTDIVAVARIEAIYQRHGARFLTKILSERERDIAKQKRNIVLYLAKRYAAKEAVLKAFHTGLRGKLRWHDIEVLNDASGYPKLVLSGFAKTHFESLGFTHADISLSDEREYAIAFVVFLKR